MHNLFLLNYNNYYNRLIKKLNTLDDYLLADPNYFKIESVNFLSTDEVNASAIINVVDLAFNMNNYNYMISQREDSTDFDRWFITKIENIRGCQFKLFLRRDLISENWDNLNASALLINKGYCDISNPQFFNKEPISVTEMPINQTYLKDSSGVSWLVAYLPKVVAETSSDVKWYTKKVDFKTSTLIVDFTDTRDAIKSAVFSGRKIIGNGEVKCNYYLNAGGSVTYKKCNLISKTINSEYYSQIPTYQQYITADNDIFRGNWGLFLSNLADSINVKTYEQFNEVYKRYNNRILCEIETNEETGDTTKTYYKISIELEDADTEKGILNIQTSKVGTYIQSCYDNGSYSGNNNGISYTIKPQTVKVTFTETQLSSGFFNYSASRVNTNGSAYDCIAVPYKDEYGRGVTINGLYHDPDSMMSLMSQLSAVWGTSVVYDIQCLPYQPNINVNGDINKDYDVVWNNDNKLGNVYYVRDINRTFNIDLPIKSSNNKVDYLTKHYKLIGGNYNSSFDLKVYENNGIDYFNVDMTLLPYNPWIKINPNFKYLNGKDFNDATGLVLSGNFSISMLTNSFAEYQYNNSNYEAIFNAQMDYTEYQQKMSMIGSGISGFANALGTGIGVGKLMGRSLGVASGALSAGAGIADLVVQNKINNKQNEYTKQQYELNLGNVKSKPTTLSKVTALNINTKMFPYIEEYGCTDIEYEQVSKYLEFNGMSIGTVGDLETYLNPNYYFSAQVIRFKDITCNNYILGEINNELQQGFYIESEVN